uniref:NADH dehydrogenase subunit 4L n=1 Tax=Resomia ornicephala TaxID=557396 RepID=UPI0026E2E02C|nr:NADH dehydrogenase subunit 4L [Resomia ornicephala]WJJ70072.1 NADH dehydrogenase subunit 4L [Resomia ornicephala]WJJ70084.1 NADH dehydrogenase subunit 4L [Resomia ornicephala]
MILNLFPYILFLSSIIGIILNRTNIILILICIEIMLLSISLEFIIQSIILETILGQIYSIYIITVAAVESAIGLSIMISFYKLKGSISIRFLNLLKG